MNLYLTSGVTSQLTKGRLFYATKSFKAACIEPKINLAGSKPAVIKIPFSLPFAETFFY
jgi:hypothetical protein